MNSAIFWRLVWKEYRQQRALWTAIALGGVIFQLATLVYCSLNGVPELPNKLFMVALSIPIVYALGCGAALFAGEHEAGTFPFQQSLPVAAGRVFFAKFAFAAVSALLLFPPLWLLAFAMTSWRLPDALWHLQLWGGGVVGTIDVLIWAVLGSLVLRRVLPAAVASGVVAALLGYGSLIVMIQFENLSPRTNAYFNTLPVRTCFAFIALVIAVKLGRQWFDEHATRWRSPATRRTRSNVAAQRIASPATWVSEFTRLLWHEWRQARTTMLWCVAGYVVLSTWLAIPEGPHVYLALLPVLAAIFGASAFAADQRQGRYQFFTEHGVRPRLVWLSRQLAWGCVLAIVACVAALLQIFDGMRTSNELHIIGSLFGLAILLFAAGQLCSILIRSGIVAVFTAALCSFLLVSWIVFTGNLGVPQLLFAFPLPFIFFWGSWLYAPKWIQQRHTWRVRVVTAATIMVPLLGVVAATGAYRVYEIPSVTLSFDPTIAQPNDSPAARETAAMYQKADQLLRRWLTARSSDDSTVTSSSDDERQSGIELFLAASQREPCHFDDSYNSGSSGPFDAQQLTRAVLAEAGTRAAAGDLDGAAELHNGLLHMAAHHYQQHDETWYRSGMAIEQQLYSVLPEWADHESLHADRLQQALSELQTWTTGNRPDWEANVVRQRLNVQKFIALDDEVMKTRYGMDDTSRTVMRTLGILVPWERWRMSRLVDVYTEAELQGLREVRARAPRIPPPAQKTLPWDVRLTLSNGDLRLIRSTDVEYMLMTTR